MHSKPSARPSGPSTSRPFQLTRQAARLVISLAATAAFGSALAQSAGVAADFSHGARNGLQPAAPAPAIGTQGVAIADPGLTRPPVTPCVVQLFDGFTFTDFSERPFDYTPPAGCKGPYAKVVLEADFSVSAGQQFDRTGSLAIGGVNLFFGTTQEPSATVAPAWHIERDLTEYASLLATPQKGRVDIDNPVDDVYTGVIRGSGRILFYPARGAVKAAPGVADSVISLGTSGRPVFLTLGTDKLQRSVTLPRDVTQAYLDVYAQNQSSDEFWWYCVPDALSTVLAKCGGGTFREAWITIDGQPAGVAPVFPWIFTGGFDPTAWEPTPGVQALNFVPHRVDLTPFAALLSNGQPHTVAVQVAGANRGFAVVANLLVFRDPKGRATRGGLLENSLASQQPGGEVSNNTITTVNGTTAGTVSMTAGRSFTISGYVETPKGRVVTRVSQRLSFSNQQRYDMGPMVRNQTIDQLTTLQAETTTTAEKTRRGNRDDDDERGHGPRDGEQVITRQSLRFPFKFVSLLDFNVVDRTLNFTMGYERTTDQSDGRRPILRTAVNNSMSTTTGFNVDSGGNFVSKAFSNQAVRYTDSLGSCFDRRIETKSKVLTTVTEARNCPQGNLIDWRALPDGAPEQGLFDWVSR